MSLTASSSAALSLTKGSDGLVRSDMKAEPLSTDMTKKTVTEIGKSGAGTPAQANRANDHGKLAKLILRLASGKPREVLNVQAIGPEWTRQSINGSDLADRAAILNLGPNVQDRTGGTTPATRAPPGAGPSLYSPDLRFR